MKYKKYIVNNLGLKAMALLLALFVWAMITGKERAYSERTLESRVEYINVAEHIDVRGVRPESVRLTIKGTSKDLERLTPSDFKVTVDLKDVTSATRLDVFAEDHLQPPEGIQVTAIYPRMIEITLREFMTKDVKVRIRYKGKMKKGVVLLSRKVTPETVKIFGYKSQIDGIDTVEGEDVIALEDIEESTTFKIPLKKERDILRFEDKSEVDVIITVDNRNKKQNETAGKI